MAIDPYANTVQVIKFSGKKGVAKQDDKCWIVITDENGQRVLFQGIPKEEYTCKLQSVFHEYIPHLRLKIRVPRVPMENDVNMESHHNISLNFPKRVFDNPKADFQLDSFDEADSLPPGLETLKPLASAKDLSVITLNPKSDQTISSPGLATPFTSSYNSSTQILSDLNSAKNARKLQIFFKGGNRQRHVYKQLKGIIVEQDDPFYEYSWDIGKYGVRWGQHREYDEIPGYPHDLNQWFDNFKHWYLSQAYGTLMDEEWAQGLTKIIEPTTRTLRIYEIPGTSRYQNGLPKRLLSFVTCSDEESNLPGLELGSQVDFSLHEDWQERQAGTAKDGDQPIAKWCARIIEPLDGFAVESTGLTLMIEGKSNIELPGNTNLPSDDWSNDAQIEINLRPSDSELSARRKIKAVNLAYADTSEVAQEMQRYLLAREFPSTTLITGNKPFGGKSYVQTVADLMAGDATSQKKGQELKILEGKMTEWQKRTLHFVWENPRFLQTITGPPGTGKSTFIAIISRMLNILGYKVLLLASSNVAVDALMGKTKNYDTKNEAIRSHSLKFETSLTKKESAKATKKLRTIPTSSFPTEAQGTFLHCAAALETSGESLETETDNATKQQSKPTKDEKTVDIAKADKDSATTESPAPTAEEETIKFYCQAVRTSELMAKKASRGRPHASTIGLMPRILRAANLLTEEGIQDTASTNPFSTFREVFLHGSQTPTEENPSPPRLEKELENVAADLLSKTMLLGTTASNSDEKLLVDNFNPDVIFHDEASQTDEAELLIGIMRNCKSLKHVILVGDGRQLSPVHQSRNQKRELDIGNQTFEGPACTFEDQINKPLLTRLQDNQLPSTMFREQHRMAAGLEQPSSRLWYHDKIINAPGTFNRPEAEAAIKWRSEHTKNLTSKTPRVVFNIANGICLKNEQKSRYNLHNIAFVMEKLKSLTSTFACKDIVIMAPYRAQTAAYRRAIIKASRDQFWQGGNHDIFDVRVVTINSFMGSEASCVIFDATTAFYRQGGIGILQDPRRLNVAITRAQNFLMVVMDIEGINNADPLPGAPVPVDDKSVQTLPQTNDDTSGAAALKKVVKYWREDGCVQFVDINTITSDYVNLHEAETLRSRWHPKLSP